uniref:Histone H2A/H2B/H3 domain-containing protein n=1 Tax=Panagrellus redivivus TaxID=6233 RepID=A0A7E4VLZ4_PANRE
MNPAAAPSTPPNTRGPSSRRLLMAPKPLREPKRSHIGARCCVSPIPNSNTVKSDAPGTPNSPRVEKVSRNLTIPNKPVAGEPKMEDAADEPTPKNTQKTKKPKAKKPVGKSKPAKSTLRMVRKKAPKTVLNHTDTPRFKHGRIITHAVRFNLPLRQALFESRLAQRRDEKLIAIETILLGPVANRCNPQRVFTQRQKVKKNDARDNVRRMNLREPNFSGSEEEHAPLRKNFYI